MQISSLFDSGNIRVIRAEQPDDIMLAINKDNQSDFYQWFHFNYFQYKSSPTWREILLIALWSTDIMYITQFQISVAYKVMYDL